MTPQQDNKGQGHLPILVLVPPSSKLDPPFVPGSNTTVEHKIFSNNVPAFLFFEHGGVSFPSGARHCDKNTNNLIKGTGCVNYKEYNLQGSE